MNRTVSPTTYFTKIDKTDDYFFTNGIVQWYGIDFSDARASTVQ